MEVDHADEPGLDLRKEGPDVVQRVELVVLRATLEVVPNGRVQDLFRSPLQGKLTQACIQLGPLLFSANFVRDGSHHTP